jgi:molybdopterin-guanine dinucleotide biosynthesis protein A
LLGEYDCAVPRIEGFDQPLSAAYRPGLLAQIETLLAENQRSVRALGERVRARAITADELRDVDSELMSLRNCNSPADYRAALVAAASR